MFKSSIKALKKANIYRKRELYDNLKDFASNDYLGLAHNKKTLKQTYKKLKYLNSHSPKASMLVNGYSSIHKDFEDKLCRVNKFEAGVVLGSGFLANLALIETLSRRGDLLLIDEQYHASGILASKVSRAKVEFFSHNNMLDLKSRLQNKNFKQIFIAVEGVYSMSGDIVNKKVFKLANKYNAVLIVDEAHSSGVLGKRLTGVFEHYKIKVKKNHIKMGTLGKAYGSYGAYILASKSLVEFL